MRVVVALGGNALLHRNQALTADCQLDNIRIAALQLVAIAREHDLLITHGNGPQVGLLALQAIAYNDVNPEVPPYPMDVLGAQTQGMLGYLLEQELSNLLPPRRRIATLITRVEVDLKDPAFDSPSKPIGPVYDPSTAQALADSKGWTMAPDGDGMRRVVASPKPLRVLNVPTIETLLAKHCVVIAAGGGGVPVARHWETAALQGVAAVIDKDLTAALLAEQLHADCLIIATDVDAVYLDWGEHHQIALGQVTPDYLAQHHFAGGSMGPKVQAACNFARQTSRPCHIGSLLDLQAMLAGQAGTTVATDLFQSTRPSYQPERRLYEQAQPH
jgi:carbamate kinase